MSTSSGGWPEVNLIFNHDEGRWEVTVTETVITKSTTYFTQLDNVLKYLSETVYDYENN